MVRFHSDCQRKLIRNPHPLFRKAASPRPIIPLRLLCRRDRVAPANHAPPPAPLPLRIHLPCLRGGVFPPPARAAGTETGCGLVGEGWQGGCSKGSAICLLFVSYLFAICSQIQIQSQINSSPPPNPKLHPPCHQDTSRIPPRQAHQGWSPGEGDREGGCSRGVAIDFLLTSY